MGLEAGNSSYQPDELVVDQLHLDAVMDLLRGLGIGPAATIGCDHDDGLGLARLRGLHAGDVVLDVGDVLSLVRQRAAAERDGWTPTIGLNRMVDAVIGIESHKPMAGSLPMPVGPHRAPGPVGGVDDGRNVRVGVVDTLAATTGSQPYRSGHALFVQSLIHRYAPAAHIEFEGVLDPEIGRATSWDTAQAMVRLATGEQELHVLNLSFGCFTAGGGPPLVIARAVERIAAKGVLIIAAAGNHGAADGLINGRNHDSACWPAAIPPVVAVGADDSHGVKAPWSPARPWVTCQAPGVDLIGDYLQGDVQVDTDLVPFTGHARWSGTSFAAAVVSGMVAAATVPGEHTAADALKDLLAKPSPVHPYVHR
ncbi:S8 family peptidase [Dactylosporangium darangshiense]|uniref:Peptidase S8/S53 domain-containing protein n=1 Tax=Dactylosporangium darangshiense TaxID=579108 RepID=A0ABP8D3X5_9ACTN